MNAVRRDRLRKVRNILSDTKDAIEAIRDEEDEARENLHENFAYSERYERSEECSSAMDDAISSIDNAISSIEDAI